MNTLFSKLAAYFVSMTANKASKRSVEWSLNDFSESGFIIIFLIGVAVVANCSAWWLLLFIFLIVVWGWLMNRTRSLVLALLYPSNGNLDENGDPVDDNLEDLMGQLDSAIKVLSEMK